jgi:hypothetical protein
MGEVFRAIGTRLRREVAIKITREQFTARFQREALVNFVLFDRLRRTAVVRPKRRSTNRGLPGYVRSQLRRWPRSGICSLRLSTGEFDRKALAPRSVFETTIH